MRELRLVPAAILVWAVTLIILLTREVAVTVPLIAVAVIGAVLIGQPGHAVLSGTVATAAATVTGLRLRAVETHHFGDYLRGVLSAPATRVSADTWLLRIRTQGYPVPVPTLLRGESPPDAAVAGAEVAVPLDVSESDRPGLGEVLASTTSVEVIGEVTGMAAVAAHVKEKFAAAVQQHVGETSQGLFPGMVLGDTSLQDETETQLYLDTGLSHLSAVSGANVAIVTTVVVLACRLLTLGPRVQTVAAAGALLGFVGLVGLEPSVLRAAVTGLVGLLAVINSARMEPVHGLCLAIIVLLLYDSDLAAAYGFALSVAATAGIVALSPLLVRALAPTRWPEILVRALAVAIAADMVTMPLVAMMAGRVSLVSVLANVLASAAVAPVTVLGLLAAGLCLLPGGLEVMPLKLAEPCTWWIHHVAQWCAGLPAATIPTPTGWQGPVWVVLCWGWVLAALVAGHPVKVTLTLAGLMLGSLVGGWLGEADRAPAIPLEQLTTHVVVSEAMINPVPVGTEVIIVTDSSGSPRDTPSVTRDGIPVLYPHRDGPVTLHSDGRQHAGDGRF